MIRDVEELLCPVVPVVVVELLVQAQTTFQAILPSVRWSSVEKLRASRYGWVYDVDAVTPNPRCSVTAAMADTARIGSFTGICVALRNAESWLP